MREFRNWDSKVSFFVFADIITGVSGILIFITLLLATDLGRTPSEASGTPDPELQERLADTLKQQQDLEAMNHRLQELLTDPELAPPAEQLEHDNTRLSSELAEARRKQAATATRLAGSESAIRARDRALGLEQLKESAREAKEAAAALAAEEGAVHREMANLEKSVELAQSQLLKARQREGKVWLIPDKTASTKEPILAVVSGGGLIVEPMDHPGQRRIADIHQAEAILDSCLREANALDQYVVFEVKPSGIELFQNLSKVARARGFDIGFDAMEENKEVHAGAPPPLETTPSSTNALPAPPAAQPTPSAHDFAPGTNVAAAPPEPTKRPIPRSWFRGLLDFLGL